MSNISKVMRTPIYNIDKLQGVNKDNINELEGTSIPPTFTFRIRLEEPRTYTLPINAGGAGYNHRFIVDWGDGSPSSSITSYDDPNRNHYYTNGAIVDPISSTVSINRNPTAGGIFNSLTETSFHFNTSPANTEWNWDGWSDLSDISTRTYQSFGETFGEGNIGNQVVGAELVMRIISESRYFKIKFTSWQSGGAGGGFAYDRTELDSSGTPISSQVHFVHPNMTPVSYNITLLGVCEYFAFNNNVDSRYFVTDVIEFTRDIGFKVLNFHGCGALQNIVPLGTKNSLTTAEYMFHSCSSLTSVPIGIFDGCPNITSFNNTFTNCTNVTSVSEDLFRYNTLVTDFSYVFASCSGIISLPENIFLYNLIATNFNSAFFYCSGIDGTAQILINNTALPGHSTPTDTDQCFYNCSNLTDYFNVPYVWGGMPIFKFQIENPESFSLPIYDGGSGYNQNFYIDWGDASPISRVTAYDDSNRTHTYDTTGTYDITMKGICQWFQSTFPYIPELTKLLEFEGDIGFRSLGFFNCTNLNTIIPLGPFLSLTSSYSLFNGCTGITSIPTGLLDKCINTTYFNNTFTNCVNITSIPADLFKFNTALTALGSIFYGCTSLTSIPTDLFRYNTAVTYFNQLFSNCTGLISIPTDLFKYNTAATTMGQLFSSCTGITSIPTDLFRYNTNVTRFDDGVFVACSGLTSIPEDLFKYNTAVTTFDFIFKECSGLTSIPTGLFRYNTNVNSFIYSFDNCMGLTSIPTDLFKYNTAVTNFQNTFSNCASLTSIPVDLFKYNTVVTDLHNLFYACTGINTNIPGNLFLYNLVALNFSYIFALCSNMTGTGQTIIDNTSLPGHSSPTDTSGCFLTCTSLSDYATLPAGWK